MKKNILVLNYEFPPLGGGASPVSYEISKGYIELGYNVDVITMGFKDLPEFEKKDGMNIYRVKSLRTKKQVCYPWEQLTYIYSGYKKAKELLKQKKYLGAPGGYDICHCHFIIPTGVIAQKLKKNFGLDYIITAHGSDVLGHNPKFSLLYKILKNPWKSIIKDAKNVISPSKYLKASIENYYGKSDKIVVIPNGIERDKFKPLKKQKYILTVSRLQKGKGIQDLIEAVKDIDLGKWKIKVVGEGPYENELKSLVKKYKLEDKVEFLGWVDNRGEQMKELYGKASIFCQPSYFENASIVLLEAMQAGCVLIARNAGGNPETVNKKGLFEDINDLRNKIEKFIGDEELLEELQKENIERIKKYEWDKIILEYDKYL